MTPTLRRGRTYRITERAGFQRLDNMGWRIALDPADDASQWRELPARERTIVVRDVTVSQTSGQLYVVADPATPRRREMLPAQYVLTAEEVSR